MFEAGLRILVPGGPLVYLYLGDELVCTMTVTELVMMGISVEVL